MNPENPETKPDFSRAVLLRQIEETQKTIDEARAHIARLTELVQKQEGVLQYAGFLLAKYFPLPGPTSEEAK